MPWSCGSAHPIRQLEQIVLAYPIGQRVRQLPQLHGIVAQLLAKQRLNGVHGLFLCECSDPNADDATGSISKATQSLAYARGSRRVFTGD